MSVMDDVNAMIERIEADLQELPKLPAEPWLRMSDGWDVLIWPLRGYGAVCDPCSLKGGSYLAQQLSDLYGHLNKHRGKGHLLPRFEQLNPVLEKRWPVDVEGKQV